MNVLSIDADFFVSPVARMVDLHSEERLPDSYETDPPKLVEYLLDRFGLTTPDVPGVFMRHHDQGFDVLRAVAARGEAIDLVHVDAHADLGLADVKSLTYLFTDFAHRTAAERANPRRGDDGLDLGNWLAFAVGAGFLSSVTFVPRELWEDVDPTDLPPSLLSSDRKMLRVARASVEDLGEEQVSFTPLGHLPCAGAAALDLAFRDSFQASACPDLVMVCQSPQFTPKSADAVLDACRRRLRVDESIQRLLTSPVGWSP
jgi:hypothetical protein